ncbi:MAG TPA: HEAT repeat domain-containing protein [Candidatus Krumholzibacteria bacterium]
MFKPNRIAMTALVLAGLAVSANAASRYDSLLSTTAGTDTLRNIALFEDQRVTGEGKLFEYLADGSPLVQLRVAEAIGRIQDPGDAPRLIPLLASTDRALARAAIFALGQLGNRDAVDPLIKARTDVPEETQLIAEALGKLGGDVAVAALLELLRDPAPVVRAEAALGLARNKDAGAATALLLLVYDPDPVVARNAIYALEKQDPLPRSCTAVLSCLDNTDPGIRAAAARTLGKLKCAAATDALVHCLDDRDIHVVVNAAAALGDIKAKSAVYELGRIIEAHKSQHARAQAAMALEAMASEDLEKTAARDALSQGLLDPSTMVRIHSIRAMAHCLKANSEMYIDQMRHDGSRLVRAEAIECYGHAGLENHAAELLEIVLDEKDPMMRVAAIHSLSKFKSTSTPPRLVPLLLDPDFTVAAAAAEYLAALQYRPAIPQLIDAYYTAGEHAFVDVEMASLSALADLKATEADTVFVQAMSHPDVRVRTLANDTLVKMGKTPPPMQTPREFHEAVFDRSRKKAVSPPLGLRHAVIKTSRGDIEVELFGDDAVQTVMHFIEWSKQGFYRKLTVHRVVPNFVIQGGDPRGDGNGDAGFTIPAEVSQRRYDEGYLGIADSGIDTGSCQWFITLSPQPRLNGRYTVFGRVTKGMETAWKIDQGDTFDVKILD